MNMKKNKIATPLITLIMISGFSFVAFGCGTKFSSISLASPVTSTSPKQPSTVVTKTGTPAAAVAAPKPTPTAAASAPATQAALISSALPTTPLTSLGSDALAGIAGTYTGTITTQNGASVNTPVTISITQLTSNNQLYLSVNIQAAGMTPINSYLSLDQSVGVFTDGTDTVYPLMTIDPQSPVSIKDTSLSANPFVIYFMIPLDMHYQFDSDWSVYSDSSSLGYGDIQIYTCGTPQNPDATCSDQNLTGSSDVYFSPDLTQISN